MIKWMIASMMLLGSLSVHAMPKVDLQDFDYQALQQQVMDASIQGLNWKVGEEANYNINMGFISGTMKMRIRQELPDSFWVDQDMDLGFMGKQKAEILFDRNTGQILKLIVGGQEQDIPEAGNQEVKTAEESSITVPAGTFDAVHLVIINKDNNEESEAWLNPGIVPIAGMIKQKAPGQFGEVVSELTSYRKL